MPRAFGRALERQDALDHVGEDRAPVERLQRAHRPARHQLDLADAELLGDEPMLLHDVVIGGDLREARAVERHRGVAGRGRQAVAEHVGDDDEIFSGIERHVGADQPLVLQMRAGVPAGIDDHIVLGGVELAIGLVGHPGAAQDLPALQRHIAKLKDLIIGHSHSLSLVWVTQLRQLFWQAVAQGGSARSPGPHRRSRRDRGRTCVRGYRR